MKKTVLLTIIGMLVSISCQAQSNSKEQTKEDKKPTQVFIGEVEKLAGDFFY